MTAKEPSWVFRASLRLEKSFSPIQTSYSKSTNRSELALSSISHIFNTRYRWREPKRTSIKRTWEDLWQWKVKSVRGPTRFVLSGKELLALRLLTNILEFWTMLYMRKERILTSTHWFSTRRKQKSKQLLRSDFHLGSLSKLSNMKSRWTPFQFSIIIKGKILLLTGDYLMDLIQKESSGPILILYRC